jgi:hypothetical protein
MDNCGCGLNRVNAKVARLNALITFVFGLIFLLSSNGWISYLLVVDFFIRGAFHPKYSPFSRLNSWFLDLIKEEPKPIFAPPKLFANKAGLAFSILIAVFYSAGYWPVAETFAIILTIFAFLEFAFEFCMGCWVYDLYYSLAGSSDVKLTKES